MLFSNLFSDFFAYLTSKNWVNTKLGVLFELLQVLKNMICDTTHCRELFVILRLKFRFNPIILLNLSDIICGDLKLLWRCKCGSSIETLGLRQICFKLLLFCFIDTYIRIHKSLHLLVKCLPNYLLNWRSCHIPFLIINKLCLFPKCTNLNRLKLIDTILTFFVKKSCDVTLIPLKKWIFVIIDIYITVTIML